MAAYLSQEHKKQLARWTSCECTLLNQLIVPNNTNYNIYIYKEKKRYAAMQSQYKTGKINDTQRTLDWHKSDKKSITSDEKLFRTFTTSSKKTDLVVLQRWSSVVKVVLWSRGAHLTKPGWSKPHTHSNPTNLALFTRKITLYRFNQGAHTIAGGLKWEQGAEPPSEPPHFNHCWSLKRKSGRLYCAVGIQRSQDKRFC